MKDLLILIFSGLTFFACKKEATPAAVSPVVPPVVTTPIAGKTFYVDASKTASGEGLTEATVF